MGFDKLDIGHAVSCAGMLTSIATLVARATALFLLPGDSFAGSHFSSMPLHEDAIAMVESAAPIWQAAAILIEHEGHDGGCGECDRHQLSQICSFACQLTNDLVDALHGIEERAHQFLAIHLATGRVLDASQSRALRDVLEEIVGIERAGIIFDYDASGLWVERPRAKPRNSLGCGPRRSHYRAVVVRLDECACSNSQIPRMMVHQAQRFIDTLGLLPTLGMRAWERDLLFGVTQASPVQRLAALLVAYLCPLCSFLALHRSGASAPIPVPGPALRPGFVRGRILARDVRLSRRASLCQHILQ